MSLHRVRQSGEGEFRTMKSEMNSAETSASKVLSPTAQQLIASTAELLSERSSIEVSLMDIARKSGLNSALIKYYFGNKEGLLLAVLERDAEHAMVALRELIELDLPADKKLKIHISGIINAYFKSPYLNQLIHHMVEKGEPDSSNRVNSIFIEPMLEVYRSIIDQGVNEGIFRPAEPAFLYYSLVGAANHIFHASYSVPSTLGVKALNADVKQRYITHISEIYLNGLRA